ncbi:MAG TPA: YkgJ family cysteine cluster protein [Pseudomonadota bacterium]|jgi:hypothetical protein|nr:YkgJ family cysteine cluster protein [Pseudomonadota bacterium]
MSSTYVPKHAASLDDIWTAAASQLGLSVARSKEGFVYTDPRGHRLVLAADTQDTADDVARLVFFDLCSAFVRGETSFDAPVWGLLEGTQSLLQQRATMRLQAALLRRYGLRKRLAPPTSRTASLGDFYESLPRLPFSSASSDVPNEERTCAERGLALAHKPPYRRVLHDALWATAQLGRAPQPNLSQNASAPRLHKSGLPMSDGTFEAEKGATCQDCAFLRNPEKRGSAHRCEQTALSGTAGKVVKPDAAACALFEPPLDCQACAACCRHAFELVPVLPTEEMCVKHPQLVQKSGKCLTVARDPDKKCCAVLGKTESGHYRCRLYAERPNTCREFTAGSANCVEARLRIGIA